MIQIGLMVTMVPGILFPKLFTDNDGNSNFPLKLRFKIDKTSWYFSIDCQN
jgi:hypothetical protein